MQSARIGPPGVPSRITLEPTMEVVLRRGDLSARPAGLVAIGIFEGERRLTGAAAAIDRAAGGLVSALLKSEDFRGRWLETALLHPRGSRARRVLVMGMGKPAAFTPRDRSRFASFLDAAVGKLAREAALR